MAQQQQARSSSQQFWRPQLSSDRDIASSDPLSASSGTLIYNRFKHLSLRQQRENLPIYRHRRSILYALERYTTLILVGETGCGKSTQLPLYLFEAGWTEKGYSVVCTQPRRVAVITVANRVAAEFGCSVGEEVGYGIRFDFQCSSKTRIKYYTDGVLLRETMVDPLLSKYSVVIVDEAHQRTLHSDILLGLLKKIQRKRKDLRIIVTSATLDATALKEFFETNADFDDKDKDQAVILSVQGRAHPVDIFYLSQPCRDYVETAVETVLKIHAAEDSGDILVFLPGGEEIDFAVALLGERYQGNDLWVLPLYASLPNHMQMAVFEATPANMRKVVVATNIGNDRAESMFYVCPVPALEN